MQNYLQNYIHKFSRENYTELNKCLLEFKSQRAELINSIYNIYIKHHKKSNWKKFINLYKEDTEINRKDFINSKNYFKAFDIKRFCFRLSHISTEDLYYVLSIAKDKDNRKEDFGAWIMWATKAQKDEEK